MSQNKMKLTAGQTVIRGTSKEKRTARGKARRGKKPAAESKRASAAMYTPPIRGVGGSPFKVARTWAMGGQEDVELVKMRYETSSAFTATSGAASYLQIKGNSIYRPYPGNTDSCAGYQRLYTQYARSMVLGSRIEVRLWSDTGAGVQQPFRLAAVPVTTAAYTVYSGFSNVTSLRGVPHSTEKLFSPGAPMPVLRNSGTTSQIQLGLAKETGVEVVTGATTGFVALSGADPFTLWYHLVGLQAMAGTTTLNAQIQVMIEYDVMWFQPVATAVQQLTKWGTESDVGVFDPAPTVYECQKYPPSGSVEAKSTGVEVSDTKPAPVERKVDQSWVRAKQLLDAMPDDADEEALADVVASLSKRLNQRACARLESGAGAGALPGIGLIQKQENKSDGSRPSSTGFVLVKKSP